VSDATGPSANLPLVSVIAPVYNEVNAIDAFMDRTLRVIEGLEYRYRFELVLVDDGSRDRSLEVMKERVREDQRIRVLELCRNYGQTPALQAGLDAAKGEIFVTMDADLQHFPEDIPQFLTKLDEGYDMVCGWRHDRKEGVLRRWPSRVANKLIRLISGIEIHDFGTTFRAYRSDLARRLRLFGEFHRYIPVLGALSGGRITEIPIQNVERPFGKSNYGLGRTLGVFLDLIVLYFLVRYMDRPMRAFGKLGLAAFALGLAILVTLVVISFVEGYSTVRERSGWFLMSIMFMITSVQLILAGILAEIMVRVHYSHPDQRTYSVRQEWHTSPAADHVEQS
jgi:glycosyltransferase involved in cell wall biosynthesis